jgi:hypothetical protein
MSRKPKLELCGIQPYVGFPREAVPKESWSCAKEGGPGRRTGSWEELKATFEDLLEGEIATPLAWDRLMVPLSALKSAELPQLGETIIAHQRKLLDDALQQKAASSTGEASADAAYTPRAACEWEGGGNPRAIYGPGGLCILQMHRDWSVGQSLKAGGGRLGSRGNRLL